MTLSRSVTIIEKIRKRAEKTPDFKFLKKFKHIPLFVYDDFKQGKQQSHFLSGSIYLGKGRTHSNDYIMKMCTHPIVFINKDKKSNLRGYVSGEVYAVTLDHILLMDRIRNNGKIFRRVKRSILLQEQEIPVKEGKSSHPYVPCYIYLGVDDFWEGAEGMCTSMLYKPSGDKSKAYFEYLGGDTRWGRSPSNEGWHNWAYYMGQDDPNLI